MSHLNIVRLLAISCALQALVASAIAEEPSTNTAPVFTATVHKGEIVGSDQIQRVFITSGQHSFLLISPPGLTVDATTPNKVAFQPPDGSFFIIARMDGSDASEPTTSVCTKRIMQSYPGAKIIEESSVRIDGQSVPVFDVLWKPAGASERLVRVAFYPSAAGLIEFSVVSEARKAAEAQEAFSGVVRGFRTNKNGKIEIVPFSNCS